jgi:Tol biopolymer transport system component
VADRSTRDTTEPAGRDACQAHASLPFFVRRLPLLLLAGLTLAAPPAGAQLAPRPWLQWRTTETEHFVFHYPVEYRDWTLALARRVEGVRAQVTGLVGFAPERRVHVVVDDPANEANGYAFTPLDAPTIVLWPTPPDPREEIGNARVWQELLVTHEYAHIAHLTRPSRNRFRRLLWSLSPVPLGPIALKSPRWVLEGYATYVEGRVTGSGRPNNAWRAALLRQFALEGRLPSYGQLNATGGGWEAGSFAYLAGSAYLEWLARREGDSSLVALWRRLTAVTNRSFEQAFAGVYGGSPADLYGRFEAELTGEALAVERALRARGIVEGTLVQRLMRDTGDPAVSPDGRYVAVAIRHRDAPSELVVWKSADEPDTTAARRREALLKRDPQDVPDRSFIPPPKRAVITLVAPAGAPYESPRWLADGKHLLVTRATPTGDGTLRHDLYLWNAEDGDLRRLTRGAALRNADPSPDGRWAAAVRCAHGWCDLVRVDLATSAVRVLRPGSVNRNYYRPRVSRTSGEIVVAEQQNDRWRIALVSPETGALRYADPDDGVTRYDASFARDGRTIIVTSEAGGIANLERLDSLGAAPVRLTRVTGAAVAADVAPDGAIWFLSLHGRGYDVRRLPADSAAPPAPVVVAAALADSVSAVLPPRAARAADDSSRRPTLASAPAERAYGIGPTRVRVLPASTSGVGGSSTQLALVRSDPVGRFGIALLGSVGSAALPAGGVLTVTSRTRRTELSVTGWLSHEAPSRELPQALDEGLDLSRGGGALRAERSRIGDGATFTGTLALLAERQRATGMERASRTAAIGALRGAFRQRDEETRFQEELVVSSEAGRARDGAYVRHRGALLFGFGQRSQPPTTLQLAHGIVGGGPGAVAERFVVGGFASPLIEPLYDARRVDAPAYPLGSSAGTTFTAYRAAVPLAPILSGVDVFYSGVSTDYFRRELRSYGVEIRQRLPAIAALGTPDVDVLTGVARAVDEPVKGAWRYYATLALRP